MKPMLLVALAVAALVETQAYACGGCFQPPETVSSLTEHRMALSITDQQSTLWDQIRYTGTPSDFVWVLPIPAVGKVAVADEGFFDQLDRATAPQILPLPPPQRGCPAPPPGYGYAADAGVLADMGAVNVYSEEAVGPYETAQIGSDDPVALETWLTAHGYNIPDSTKPVIAFYVQKKFIFVAMRLKPTVGVQQMQPVRVTFPGLLMSLPLKMVTVGAGDTLGLTLWIAADQRYHAMNYPDALIPFNSLKWSYQRNRSNYTDLFDGAMQATGGKGWVTEYAGPLYLYDYNGDDAATATAKLPSAIWTRLRTNATTAQLTDDLVLAPNPNAQPVDRVHQVVGSLDTPPAPPPCPVYPQPYPSLGPSLNAQPGLASHGCSLAAGSAVGGAGGALLLLLVVLGLGRGKRRA
jgi:hypothetical protein